MISLLPNRCFLSETSRVLEIHRVLVARDADVRVALDGPMRAAGAVLDLAASAP